MAGEHAGHSLQPTELLHEAVPSTRRLPADRVAGWSPFLCDVGASHAPDSRRCRAVEAVREAPCAGRRWPAGGGVLAYRPRNDNRRLVWVRRDGTEVSLPAPPKRYAAPSLSPNGDRIAVEIEEEGLFDIWTIDVERQTPSKLTSDGASRYPMWTPDGRSVGVVQRRDITLYVTAPGEGQRHELVRAALPIWIGSWSRNMRTLIYMLESPARALISGRSISRRMPHVLSCRRPHGIRRTGVARWPVARLLFRRNKTIRAVPPPARAQRAALPDFDDQRARAGSRPGSSVGEGTVANCSTVTVRR